MEEGIRGREELVKGGKGEGVITEKKEKGVEDNKSMERKKEEGEKR